eukprot:TRINITY_DN3381_c0_g1_i7.p7 TRINITY_DN3381_c0_g1~~TRINITY_DN3381_c0_g1_i7.p7  ORF type:complete len:121 (-),score=0.67 TRINITY_DN3381_c0_g1_i7:901-1263(-)
MFAPTPFSTPMYVFVMVLANMIRLYVNKRTLGLFFKCDVVLRNSVREQLHEILLLVIIITTIGVLHMDFVEVCLYTYREKQRQNKQCFVYNYGQVRYLLGIAQLVKIKFGNISSSNMSYS